MKLTTPRYLRLTERKPKLIKKIIKKIIDDLNEFNRYDPIDKCAESHEKFHRYIGLSDDGDCLHSFTV